MSNFIDLVEDLNESIVRNAGNVIRNYKSFSIGSRVPAWAKMIENHRFMRLNSPSEVVDEYKDLVSAIVVSNNDFKILQKKLLDSIFSNKKKQQFIELKKKILKKFDGLAPILKNIKEKIFKKRKKDKDETEEILKERLKEKSLEYLAYGLLDCISDVNVFYDKRNFYSKFDDKYNVTELTWGNGDDIFSKEDAACLPKSCSSIIYNLGKIDEKKLSINEAINGELKQGNLVAVCSRNKFKNIIGNNHSLWGPNNKPEPKHLKQKVNDGNCWLIAALKAIASKYPSIIMKAFGNISNDSYANQTKVVLHLYSPEAMSSRNGGAGQKVSLEISRDKIIDEDQISSGVCDWPDIIQTAFSYFLRGLVEGGSISDGLQADYAIAVLGGYYSKIKEYEVKNAFQLNEVLKKLDDYAKDNIVTLKQTGRQHNLAFDSYKNGILNLWLPEEAEKKTFNLLQAEKKLCNDTEKLKVWISKLKFDEAVKL